MIDRVGNTAIFVRIIVGATGTTINWVRHTAILGTIEILVRTAIIRLLIGYQLKLARYFGLAGSRHDKIVLSRLGDPPADVDLIAVDFDLNLVGQVTAFYIEPRIPGRKVSPKRFLEIVRGLARG